MGKSKGKLNDRQAAFVREYLVDLNATQAAIRAGYAEKTAGVTGHNLLKNPKVQTAVEHAKAKRAEKTEITAERVLRELAAMAFANLGDYVEFGPGGVMIRSKGELSREQLAALQSVTDQSTASGRTIRVKMADKAKALEMLGRHLGMFLDVTKNVNFNTDASKLSDEERRDRIEHLLSIVRPGSRTDRPS